MAIQIMQVGGTSTTYAPLQQARLSNIVSNSHSNCRQLSMASRYTLTVFSFPFTPLGIFRDQLKSGWNITVRYGFFQVIISCNTIIFRSLLSHCSVMLLSPSRPSVYPSIGGNLNKKCSMK